jgi:hypothetical protein
MAVNAGRLSVPNVCARIEFAVPWLRSRFGHEGEDTSDRGTATQSRRGRVSDECRVFARTWRDRSSQLDSSAWPGRRYGRGPDRQSEVYRGFRIDAHECIASVRDGRRAGFGSALRRRSDAWPASPESELDPAFNHAAAECLPNGEYSLPHQRSTGSNRSEPHSRWVHIPPRPPPTRDSEK